MQCFLIILPKGSIYKVNNIGPSTEPCGTPWLTLALIEASESLCDFTSHLTWMCLKLVLTPCPCFLHPASGLDLASFPMALPPSLCLLPQRPTSMVWPLSWCLLSGASPCWCPPPPCLISSLLLTPVAAVRSRGSCVLVMRPDVGGARRQRCSMTWPARCRSPVESAPTWTSPPSWESPSASCGCTT